MDIDPRDQEILNLRDRMIERHPGLRESYQRFLIDFEKYLDLVEGMPKNPPPPRKSPYRRERGWKMFRSRATLPYSR